MKPGVKAGNKTLCGSLSHSKKLINLRFGTKTVFGVFRTSKNTFLSMTVLHFVPVYSLTIPFSPMIVNTNINSLLANYPSIHKGGGVRKTPLQSCDFHLVTASLNNCQSQQWLLNKDPLSF